MREEVALFGSGANLCAKDKLSSGRSCNWIACSSLIGMEDWNGRARVGSGIGTRERTLFGETSGGGFGQGFDDTAAGFR